MTITIELPADVASRLSEKAGRDGQDVPTYLRQIAVREAAVWDALLDSFAEGNPEDHRETVAALARALNEDRPGQRRVFGTAQDSKKQALVDSPLGTPVY